MTKCGSVLDLINFLSLTLDLVHLTDKKKYKPFLFVRVTLGDFDPPLLLPYIEVIYTHRPIVLQADFDSSIT